MKTIETEMEIINAILEVGGEKAIEGLDYMSYLFNHYHKTIDPLAELTREGLAKKRTYVYEHIKIFLDTGERI